MAEPRGLNWSGWLAAIVAVIALLVSLKKDVATDAAGAEAMRQELAALTADSGELSARVSGIDETLDELRQDVAAVVNSSNENRLDIQKALLQVHGLAGRSVVFGDVASAGSSFNADRKSWVGASADVARVVNVMVNIREAGAASGMAFFIESGGGEHKVGQIDLHEGNSDRNAAIAVFLSPGERWRGEILDDDPNPRNRFTVVASARPVLIQ
jgi:hypothetical protein